MKPLTPPFAIASFIATSRAYLDLPVAMLHASWQERSTNVYRNFARSLLLAGGLSGLFAGPVFAGPECDTMGRHEMKAEQRSKMMDSHHQQLQAALKLTPAQEPGWKKLIASEKPNAPNGAAREDWAKLSPPDRAEKMLEQINARQAHMVEYVAALKDFYASLSSEQQKVFEDMHAGQRAGRHGKAGHHKPMAMPQPAKG
jgi:periplasmic protein CpxP/Spy